MTRVSLVILLITAVAASAQTVSVMQLLQSPRQFDGRRVAVSGYYYSDWEGHALFADLEAAKRYDRSRAIWIEADPIVESPVRRASITGVFIYSRHYRPDRVLSGFGVYGGYSAQLVNCFVHLHK